MVLEKTKKLFFPGLLLTFELLILVLFALLVEYDEGGQPGHEAEVAAQLANGSTGKEADDYLLQLQSTISTTKVYPFFQDVHVMIFVGFGFLMTFLRRYAFSSVGFNMMLAAFAIQWATITLGFFSFIGQHQDGASRYTITVSLESLVLTDFAAAAVLITFGAVLGRASMYQIFVIAFLEIIFYSANEAINVYVYEAADVGGSMIIHTFGAYFGLACSLPLFRKKAKDHQRNSSVYHSDLFAMIGTLFLWLFWPSFNGALASGNGQYRAIINTYYAMTGSVIASCIVSIVVNGKTRKLDMVHIQNATLAGGVAIGSIADMLIYPWAALLVGFIGGTLSVVGYRFLSDTCGVHNLHGIPGLLSAIAAAVAAGVASSTDEKNRVNYGSSLYLVFPARASSKEVDLGHEGLLLGFETGHGRSSGEQAGFQLALLVSTLVIAIVGGLITGVIAKAISFAPGFTGTRDDQLFDDDTSWELPDHANNYLPLHHDDDDKLVEMGVVNGNGLHTPVNEAVEEMKDPQELQ